MTKTIMPFSGGLDSTYLLYKLLTTTAEEITVVYIVFSNLETTNDLYFDIEPIDQIDHKKKMVTDIINWLKANTRDFTVIEHEYDPTIGSNREWRNSQCYITKYALPKINNNEYDKLVLAVEKENDGFNNGRFNNIPAATRAVEIFKESATRGTISFPLTESNYHQGYALSELPAELLNLTRSCDNAPFNEPPCGYCFKCSKRKFFKQLIDKGMSMSDIWEYVWQKSVKPGRKWSTMKYWLREENLNYNLFNDKHVTPLEYTERDMPLWPKSYTVPN